MVLPAHSCNFGAGFSGGNVYVLDLDMKQVNPAAATNGALLFEPLDADADKLVHGLVKQHAEETGSAFAKALLDDWENSAKRFTHIVPKALPRHAEGDEGSRGEEHRFQYARRLGTGVRAGYGRSALTWEISWIPEVRTVAADAGREETNQDWFVHTRIRPAVLDLGKLSMVRTNNT